METFIDLLGKPRGLLAPFLLGMMNIGHKPFIKAILSEIQVQSTDIVLDIGCGGGNAIALLAPWAQKVYGVDISSASVKKAAEKNKTYVDSGQVHISQADAASLPFDDGMFDLITAFETIYFWSDLDYCFSSILKKLKPGGLLLAACEATRGEDGGQKGFEKMSRGRMRTYSRQEIYSTFERAGFVSISSYCPNKTKWLCMGGRRL